MCLSPSDVTVVIPVINEAGNLKACIESACNAGAIHVVVVDGGSEDGSPEIALQAGATVVVSEPGRGIQQHAGAENATTSLLCFLHADCRLSTDALAELCEFANAESDVYACFRQRIQLAGLKYRLLEYGNAWRVKWFNRPYGDQGICVSTRLYFHLGGFEAVPFMEDVLLAESMKQAGMRPQLLSAKIEIDPRRWQKNGVVRQTLRNWGLLRKLKKGISPTELALLYPRHDREDHENSE